MTLLVFPISLHSVRFVLSNIGQKISKKDVEDMLREADINGDGSISYDGQCWCEAGRGRGRVGGGGAGR